MNINANDWRVMDYDPAYPNQALIRIPGGYIEINGARAAREAIAELIVLAVRKYQAENC